MDLSVRIGSLTLKNPLIAASGCFGYGVEYADVVETLAIERAKQLFGCAYANVQPNSGSQMNQAVFLALLQPGDTFMGLDLNSGGHLTHGSPVNLSGRFYNFVSYKVSPGDERIDMDQVRQLAVEHRPKLIVAGTTSYPRRLDPVAFRSIADEVGALLMFDAAHIAGLIAGGQHPDPVPHADVVTFTTHKTLRGPRGGTVLAKSAHAAAIDKPNADKLKAKSIKELRTFGGDTHRACPQRWRSTQVRDGYSAAPFA